MRELPPEPSYKIIGGDGREYGPITAEQVRQWIAQGRANGRTEILAEGTNIWRPLSAYLEFADTLANHVPESSSLAPPPPVSNDEALALTEDYASRAASMDISRCFVRSWRLLKSRFALLVGVSALACVILIALEFIPYIGAAVNTLIWLVLLAGLNSIFLKLIRKQPAQLIDLFAGFRSNGLQLMIAGVMMTFLIPLGLLLCLFPGIYLLVAWLSFGPFLMIDRNLRFWPALELSRRVVTRMWSTMFVMFLVTMVMLVVGVLAMGIGFFIAVPLTLGAVAYAYEDIFGAGSAAS